MITVFLGDVIPILAPVVAGVAVSSSVLDWLDGPWPNKSLLLTGLWANTPNAAVANAAAIKILVNLNISYRRGWARCVANSLPFYLRVTPV